jgi:site-specific DNA-cytosine methylase
MNELLPFDIPNAFQKQIKGLCFKIEIELKKAAQHSIEVCKLLVKLRSEFEKTSVQITRDNRTVPVRECYFEFVENAFGHYADPTDDKLFSHFSDHDSNSMGKYLPGFNSRLQSYHRRWKHDRPSRTVHSQLLSSEVHPNGKRRFTLREAATLQSFPEDFKLMGSLAQKFQGVANAVPPLLAWHVGNSVSKFYNEVWG